MTSNAHDPMTDLMPGTTVVDKQVEQAVKDLVLRYPHLTDEMRVVEQEGAPRGAFADEALKLFSAKMTEKQPKQGG